MRKLKMNKTKVNYDFWDYSINFNCPECGKELYFNEYWVNLVLMRENKLGRCEVDVE
jgi:hypothetical protein